MVNSSRIQEVGMEQTKLLQDGAVVLAQYAEAGRRYLSSAGREVIVKRRDSNRIVVQSVATGNDIALPLTYALREMEAVPAGI